MIEIKLGRKEKSFKAFSKRALVSMIVLWFLGAIFGFFVISVQLLRAYITVNLSDLLLYIGAPMTGGIVSYMLKSAAENKEKIKGEKYEPEDKTYQP